MSWNESWGQLPPWWRLSIPVPILHQGTRVVPAQASAVFGKHQLLKAGAPSAVQHRSAKEIIKLQNTDVLSPPCRFICLQSGPSWPLYLVILLSNLLGWEIFQRTVWLCAAPLSLTIYLWHHDWIPDVMFGMRNWNKLSFWGNINYI